MTAQCAVARLPFKRGPRLRHPHLLLSLFNISNNLGHLLFARS